MSKKQFDTLVDDIYDLFDKEDGHKCKQANVTWLASELGTVIEQAMAQSNSRQGGLRASNIGKPCRRQLWFDCHGFEGEDLAPHTKLKFLYGHVIEALLLFLAKEAGHKVTDAQKEVEIDGIKGHMDAKIDGVLVDVKSASTYSFKKFKEGTLPQDDAFGYIPQLAFYNQADYVSGQTAAFLAMDKQNGHICAYAPSNLPDMKLKVPQIKAEMEGDQPPDRPYVGVPDGKSGNQILGVECRYCAHKFNCWTDANNGQGVRVFAYSTGPKFFVEVVKEPNVPEIK